MSVATASRTDNTLIQNTKYERHNKYWICICPRSENNVYVHGQRSGNRHKCNFCFMLVLMVVVIFFVCLIPLFVLVDNDNGRGGDDNTDTNYFDNETRLMKVSSFFRDKVEITVAIDDQFSANASLYLVKEEPPLKEVIPFETSVTVSRNEVFDDVPGVHYKVFNLHTNSTITLSACKFSKCDPFYIFVIKGSKNFHHWEKSRHTENVGERSAFVDQDCSGDDREVIEYTAKKEDFYYFVTYATIGCQDEDYIDMGDVRLGVMRYEYSITDAVVEASCNTYEQPKCDLSIPLSAGHSNALVVVAGQYGDKYDIKFKKSPRGWAYFVVISPALLLLIIPAICCACCCIVQCRRRKGYGTI